MFQEGFDDLQLPAEVVVDDIDHELFVDSEKQKELQLFIDQVKKVISCDDRHSTQASFHDNLFTLICILAWSRVKRGDKLHQNEKWSQAAFYFKENLRNLNLDSFFQKFIFKHIPGNERTMVMPETFITHCDTISGKEPSDTFKKAYKNDDGSFSHDLNTIKVKQFIFILTLIEHRLFTGL